MISIKLCQDRQSKPQLYVCHERACRPVRTVSIEWNDNKKRDGFTLKLYGERDVH